MRWDTRTHIQEFGEPIFLRVDKVSNGDEVIGTSDYRTNSHEENIGQWVSDLPGTRVRDIAKMLGETGGTFQGDDSRARCITRSLIEHSIPKRCLTKFRKIPIVAQSP
ncbi:hypothetical protein Poly59_36010 [Rubripirellula reticaptiva]|uniref:Uncharacterized protein n=1 Tax=Rubripirellula reticaptiva TaxID=2528013 RepID=A0A5C6EUD3_9BACT|nr:hypothetical protein Poly59_36010 [Rubripirellula reticaptiva]